MQENTKKWGDLELCCLGMGGVADPKVCACLLVCYHIGFGSSTTKGVCINRRNSKNDEHWGPGYSTWAWRTDEHRPTAKMCLCIASFDSVAVAEVQWQKLCIDACALLFRLHIVEYSVAFMTLFWCVLMCCVWSRNSTSLVMSLLYTLFSSDVTPVRFVLNVMVASVFALCSV